MKKINVTKELLALVFVLIMSLTILAGCSDKTNTITPVTGTTSADLFNDGTQTIFDLGESRVSYGKLLYFISYYELYGEKLREYYATSMNYTGNYWDEMIDETQTEAEHYKDLVYQTTCYYEVFKNEALKKGYSLSEEELADSKKYAEDSIKVFTDEQIKKSGLKIEGMIAARNTIVLATKYIDELQLEAAKTPELITSLNAISREGFTSDADYEAAIEKATTAYCEQYVTDLLTDLMNSMNIVVSEEWGQIKMGSVMYNN